MGWISCIYIFFPGRLCSLYHLGHWFVQTPSGTGEQGAVGLLLVKRCAHGPKRVAVALTGYISVCSVTSYHACNGGNCLHCHYISSAGASWPATMQKLPQGTSPCSPDACSRLTCSCSQGHSSTTSCLWRLPASELPPDPLPWLFCMSSSPRAVLCPGDCQPLRWPSPQTQTHTHLPGMG